MFLGTVTTGLGRGKKYIGMEAYQSAFEEAVGYRPFPGTLNLAVDPVARAALQAEIDAVAVPAPVVDGERYSAVRAYPVRLDEEPAHLLVLEITDHPATIAEIIAPKNLRTALGLVDGDTVVCSRR